MCKRATVSILVAGIFFVCALQGVFAQDSATAGRLIIKEYENAVITVKLVVSGSMSMGGRQGPTREDKSEITGTLIDNSGLTVISLTATDPAGTMLSKMGPDMSEGEMKFESNLTDIKLVLPDGKETSAKVVLRDKDLDLAFIMPSEKISGTQKAVNLKDGSSASLLDEVIVINRMGQVVGRMSAVLLGHISAVIEKPRMYYVMDRDVAAGAPVFTKDGKLLGIIAVRSIPTQSRSMGKGMVFSGSIKQVIVPAAQILEASQQVPKEEKKAEEKAKETKKDSTQESQPAKKD